ncbi:MAG TPA: hypothetical protein VFW21_07880 [Mycobacterium sp.]|nr:hypothetical protein [Mycobacterium sp.]
MDISIRSTLTAGICTVAASAVVMAPALHPLPSAAPVQTHSALAVELTASTTTLSSQALEAFRAFVTSVAPGVNLPAPTDVPSTVADATPQNAASNVIDTVYSVARYWANYVALDLGPWLINWIPFGYLISDQIYIWYPSFVLPVVDSFVYQFLDPVVNDPFNWSVWADGLRAIANTAVSGAGAGIRSEINYLVSLQWFPIPLPPLPPLPFAAAAATPTALAASDPAATLANSIGEAVTDASRALTSGLQEMGRLANSELARAFNQLARDADALANSARAAVAAGEKFVSDAFGAPVALHDAAAAQLKPEGSHTGQTDGAAATEAVAAPSQIPASVVATLNTARPQPKTDSKTSSDDPAAASATADGDGATSDTSPGSGSLGHGKVKSDKLGTTARSGRGFTAGTPTAGKPSTPSLNTAGGGQPGNSHDSTGKRTAKKATASAN